ncbi:MAG TPA: T9SS type A sorting domain-containing protein [Ignavibacteria bacterium]|nr:T9SS type A sorting domain-containing protein [Ignavibacteria bacterium]
MKKLLLITLTLLFIASSVYAQINRDWVQRYNGTANSYDIVCDIIPDDSGNVFVYGTSFNTGTATDITVVKYNSSGGIVWNKKFNFGENSYDQTRAVYKDEMNNSYICGFTTEGGSDNKMITLKVDGTGNLNWSKIFTKVNYSNFVGSDIALYNDRVYVTGNGRNASGYNEMFLWCYNSGGVFQWDKSAGSGQNNYEGINLVVNGSSKITVGCNITYSTNITTVGFLRYNLDGSSNGFLGYETPSKLIKLITDNYKNLIYLTSVVHPDSLGSVNFMVIKCDSISISNHNWLKIFNGSGNHYDFPFDVCVDTQNNILVTGSSRHGDSLGTEDIVTLKYSPNGDLLWNRIWNSDSNGIDQGMSITTDAFNNVYVGGAADIGGIKLAYKILKYSPAGNLLWQDIYHHAPNPEDFVYAVRINNRNDLFVTGISFNPGTDYDFATLKYSQNVSVENISNNIPDKFLLKQNYPNPFNPSTNIEFYVPSNVKRETSNVKLIIYDMSGKELAVLVNEQLNAGAYKVSWDASNYSSGVYFYELKTNNFSETKKMLLIK